MSKAVTLEGTVELSLFIEKELNSAGGGCECTRVRVCVSAHVRVGGRRLDNIYTKIAEVCFYCLNCECSWVFSALSDKTKLQ